MLRAEQYLALYIKFLFLVACSDLEVVDTEYVKRQLLKRVLINLYSLSASAWRYRGAHRGYYFNGFTRLDTNGQDSAR